MSTMVGADADQLDRLAARMQQTSTALSLLSKTIGVALRAAPWFGGVADVFRNRWSGDHARSLAETASFLRENADVLRANAQQQRDASSATGGGGPLTGAGGHRSSPLDRLRNVTSPQEAATVWASLSIAEREDLIKHHPDDVGNLDGIPPADRIAANRLRLHRDLLALEAAGDTGSDRYKILKRLDTFDTSIDPVTNQPRGLPNVYLYDGAGDGKIAVIEGDITHAKNVGVYVPGTGAGLDGALGDLDRGRTLYQLSGPGTAIMTWIGYDAPDAVFPTQNGQPILNWGGDNAMLEKFANDGSVDFSNSLTGLGLSSDTNLTVIGHSYGSLVAVRGAHINKTVDNIIVAGSPGVGFRSASDVDINGTFYTLNAPGDKVGRVPIFGENPSDPGFGATRLSTGQVDNPRAASGQSQASSGHSAYFDNNSTSAFNIADIVSGNPERANRQAWTLAERVGDFVPADPRDPLGLTSQFVDYVQRKVDLPQPLDDGLDVSQGIGRAIGGAREWGVEALVDGAEHAVKKLPGL